MFSFWQQILWRRNHTRFERKQFYFQLLFLTNELGVSRCGGDVLGNLSKSMTHCQLAPDLVNLLIVPKLTITCMRVCLHSSDLYPPSPTTGSVLQATCLHYM